MILILANLTNLCVVGQNRISGMVLDASNKLPLQFANVFINNTTIGTHTNQQGGFEITDLPAGKINLIISFVGYKQESYWIDVLTSNTPFKIELVPYANTLNEVIVKADKDKNRKKYLKLFEKEFFGNHNEKCKILNPEILDVYEDENNQLVAQAFKPLEIENGYLGYRVLFYLKSFQSRKDGYEISGYSYFQPLPSETELRLRQWELNRSKAYFGSLNHFTKSLASGTLSEDGFKLYVPVSGKEKSKRSPYFYTRELNKTVLELPPDSLVISKENGLFRLKGSIEVHYTNGQTQNNWYLDVRHQVSWIESTRDTLYLDSEGSPSYPESILTFGDISQRRISEMLPLDFVRLVFENKALSATQPKNLHRTEESVYLHLNKPYYFPGDSIWYKPYLRYKNLNSNDSLSNVLYVELINPNREIIASSKINIKDSPEGNFVLPDSITGSYFVRAFTSLSRNSGDSGIYYAQTPVLSNYQNIGRASIKLDESIGLTICTSKNIYGLRDKIVLEIRATDAVSFSSLSVSVVDSVLSLPWRGMNSIIDASNSLQSTNQLKNKFPTETALSFRGSIKHSLKNRNDLVVNIIQPELGYFATSEITQKGTFEIDNLNFYGLSNFMFHVPANKKIAISSITAMDDTPPLMVPEFLKTTEVQLESQNDLLRSDNSYKVGRGTRLLKEVQILAKKSGPIPNGKPDLVISSDKFRPVSHGTNLLLGLQGKVPGLSVMQYRDEMGLKKVEVRLPGGLNTFFYVEPLILVDSIPWGGVNDLFSLSLDLVDRIEIMNRKSDMYGPRSSAGVISVITKFGPYASANSIKEMQNFKLITLIGYSKPIKFFSPDYTVMKDSSYVYDYRSTLYWNPELKLNDRGYGSVEFYSGDIESTYRCIIEGVIDNNYVRGVYFFKIRQ